MIDQVTARRHLLPIRHAHKEYQAGLSVSDRFAAWIVGLCGTTACFWLFSAFALMPLLWPAWMQAVQFISSGYLQLVLLPLILVSQNLQSRHDEIRAQAHYDADLRADAQVQELMDGYLAITEELKAIRKLSEGRNGNTNQQV